MRALRAGLVHVLGWWLRLPLVLRLLAPVAVMVVLWGLSAQPSSGGKQSLARRLLDNGAHIVAYFGLAGAWLLALLPRDGARSASVPRVVIGAAFGLSVMYGIVDEVHQSFVPGRAPSAWDVATDACGSAIAVAFVLWLLSAERRFAIRVAIGLILGVACVFCGTLLGG